MLDNITGLTYDYYVDAINEAESNERLIEDNNIGLSIRTNISDVLTLSNIDQILESIKLNELTAYLDESLLKVPNISYGYGVTGTDIINISYQTLINMENLLSDINLTSEVTRIASEVDYINQLRDEIDTQIYNLVGEDIGTNESFKELVDLAKNTKLARFKAENDLRLENEVADKIQTVDTKMVYVDEITGVKYKLYFSNGDISLLEL